MNNRLGIGLASFALIVNMLYFWYADTLENRYFVLVLIPLAFAVYALIASVVFSVIEIATNKTILKAYIPLAISLITVALIIFFPFRMAKVKTELYLLEKDRMQVVEMVQNGELAVDELGNAQLPAKYNMTSSDGSVFVYQNDEEQVVSFWVFRGMLSGSIELIYSSGDESLIYQKVSAHPIENVTKLKEHWYLVDTDY